MCIALIDISFNHYRTVARFGHKFWIKICTSDVNFDTVFLFFHKQCQNTMFTTPFSSSFLRNTFVLSSSHCFLLQSGNKFGQMLVCFQSIYFLVPKLCSGKTTNIGQTFTTCAQHFNPENLLLSLTDHFFVIPLALSFSLIVLHEHNFKPL